MEMNKRGFMRLSAGAILYATSVDVLWAQNLDGKKPIRVGNALDKSGGLNIYCLKQIQAVALAVDEINNSGGLLGRPVEVIFYDLQSVNDTAARYATQAFVKDKVDVLHGAVTSSAREVIRPIVRRYKGLYFYGATYEGGVCDRRTVCPGMEPTQQLAPLVNYVADERGARRHYILAADYNYGELTSNFIKKLVGEKGGDILGVDFYPLDVSNFAVAIDRLKNAKPDVVWSALVGEAHNGFYRQFQAGIGKENMDVVGCVYTSGRNNVILSPEEGNGIITAASFYDSLDSEEAKSFVEKFHKYTGESDFIGDYGEYGYRDIMLWAEAVRRADDVKPDAVIDKLSGTSVMGPGGKYTLDDANHCIMDVHIGIGNMDKDFDIVASYNQLRPVFTESVCNLKENPEDTTQYEPEF